MLYFVNYRTNSKPPGNITELDVSKSSQLSPILTVSSNFEVHSPRVYYLCHIMVFLSLIFYTIILTISIVKNERMITFLAPVTLEVTSF